MACQSKQDTILSFLIINTYFYLIVSLHFLDITNKVDEPKAPLFLALVHFVKVLLELLKDLVQFGHVLSDRGQGQGKENQNENLLHRYLLLSD